MAKVSKSISKSLYREMNKSCFRYYNCNPAHLYTDDCVIRAISSGLNKTWNDVFVDLNKIAYEKKIVLGDERVYGSYLANNGWSKQKQPIKPDGKKYHINEFLESFKSKAIVHAGKCHISFVMDGKLYDIFNCEDDIIGCYWIQQQN